MEMAVGSARELEFQWDLAQQLGFLGENESLIELSHEVARLVAGLANAFTMTPGSAADPSDDAS